MNITGVTSLRGKTQINQINTIMNIITNDGTCSEGKILFALTENNREAILDRKKYP
jgi:hypothetical protein